MCGYGRGEEVICNFPVALAIHSSIYLHLILYSTSPLYCQLDFFFPSEWNKLIESKPELAAVSDYSSRRIIEGVAEITPHIDTWRKQGHVLPGNMVFNLYRTYGLSMDLINELAGVYNLTVDQEGFETILEEYKINTRNKYLRKLNKRRIVQEEELLDHLQASGIPTTNDDAKYIYEMTSDGYKFPPLDTKILALITEEGLVDWVSGGTKVGVITEATSFYHEAGGQEGDTGRLFTDSAEVSVDDVDNVGGYLVHWGTNRGGEMATGERVTSAVDHGHRLGCMQHHTATHLLNSAIKSVVGEAWFAFSVSLSFFPVLMSKHLYI